MAKKKEQAPKEQAQQTPETNGTAEEAEQVPEIPETVTLTRDEFDQVKNRIDALQKDKDDTVAMAQRLQADFDNYRKRNAAIRMDSLEEGTRELIRSLLPVLDNFDRALDNSEAADQGWVDGVRLVHKQFMGILEKNGLTEIPAEGAFNADLHEAVMQEEAEGVQSGEILSVLQKGYKVKDRIIRHSMVKVAK
ncbi:MAG: nucleotide exchange factor GrpE [Christensenellaceae bacterium]|nr:nucleotide exchange factor GrpE [Christensenellaceae bacterium]